MIKNHNVGDVVDSVLSKKICDIMNIGSLTKEPTSISGGLLHKIFEINTTKGKYAVKILNPEIINEDRRLSDFIFSEKVAQIVHDNGINALPAISKDGNSILHIDGQYLLVFHWFDGEAVIPNSIEVNKCTIIGELLAKIHKLDFSSITSTVDKKYDYKFIDWGYYEKILSQYGSEWNKIFFANISTITNMQEKTSKACKQLSNNLIIGHRDLLQKNVLWNINNVPMIIDWESAGFINPGLELVDTALFWSGGHKGLPDIPAFNGFIQSYIKNGGKISSDIDDILIARFKSKFEWLEYNLKGALGIECEDIGEQQKCSKRVVKTIDSILIYIEIIPTIKKYIVDLK